MVHATVGFGVLVRDARGVLTDYGPVRARVAGYAGSLVTYHRAPEKPQVRYGDPNAARRRRGEHMLDRGRVLKRLGDKGLVKGARASENQGVQPTKTRRSAR